MALQRQKTRKRASITSLIDVIFLLLLFFMLASTFSKFSDVDITVAQASGAFAQTNSQSIKLLIEPNSIRVDDRDISEDELVEFLGARSEIEPLTVSVKASETCSTQRLIDILVNLGRVDNLNLVIVDPR